MQVLTCCCDAFAHEANDVANSIGPFSAIWHVYRKQALTKKSDVPIWILVIGGAGIVLGLATYGYSIIKAIGVKLTKITPARGFSIEIGSALIVVTGSYMACPSPPRIAGQNIFWSSGFHCLAATRTRRFLFNSHTFLSTC